MLQGLKERPRCGRRRMKNRRQRSYRSKKKKKKSSRWEGIQRKRKNYPEERAQNCQRTTDTERSPEREHAVPNDHTLQPCDLPHVTPTRYLHCCD
uniref:Uncharacterized protein n=1 Tax=Mustela putorius furo TaxID=9669 RepID=M3XZQ9_MUSPF